MKRQPSQNDHRSYSELVANLRFRNLKSRGNHCTTALNGLSIAWNSRRRVQPVSSDLAMSRKLGQGKRDFNVMN
jgi:hypothetical protein